jgi:ubiquinone/menaquinone biosynthesis C-methylase UbiE
MTRAVTFWNFIANRYAKQSIGDEVSYQRKLDMTQAVMHPDMSVLEFGCGTGSTALIHAPHVAKITGIDYASKMIAIAQDKAAAVPNASFEVASIEDWDAPDASYDMILGMNIVHLVPDRHVVLDKVRRLLRPGGYFVSSTACLGDEGALVRYLLPIASATRLIPKVAQFSTDEFESDVRRAGFEITENWRPGPGRAVFMIARAV